MMKGYAWKFGSDVDTDVIIPARYLNTIDPAELARHCMEDADPEFARKVRKGDIIVAEENFGCGSSREHAPIAIKAAGLSCVIARSFARIFYRNAINIGLPIFESPAAVDGIRAGDELEVDSTKGVIRNITRGETYQVAPFPEFMQQIMAKGGLIEYVRERVKSVESR
ncbi:MAG: 3-isopropylmalate dehydratase small subunit [Syntrophothermus sp.]